MIKLLQHLVLSSAIRYFVWSKVKAHFIFEWRDFFKNKNLCLCIYIIIVFREELKVDSSHTTERLKAEQACLHTKFSFVGETPGKLPVVPWPGWKQHGGALRGKPLLVELKTKPVIVLCFKPSGDLKWKHGHRWRRGTGANNAQVHKEQQNIHGASERQGRRRSKYAETVTPDCAELNVTWLIGGVIWLIKQKFKTNHTYRKSSFKKCVRGATLSIVTAGFHNVYDTKRYSPLILARRLFK